LPPEQQALALHRSFALLAPLYREGLTAVSWPLLQQLPGLAERLPPAFDPDAAAAVHYRLFHFNLFPYESFFLDESGLLGGERTAAVTTFYQQAGFSPQTAVAADHISQQLALLAFLCGAEADAVTDGLPAQVERVRRLRQHFYRSHLLRWLPPFLTATTELVSGPFTAPTPASPLLPFYDSLARLTGDLIAVDWSDLTAGSGQSGVFEPLPAMPGRLSLSH
jgi:TorA maturation chaperone TorD